MRGARERSQGVAKLIVGLRCIGDARGVLVPQLVASRDGQTSGRAIDHVRHARINQAANVLIRHAHNQVSAAIAIEVTAGQGNTKVVVRLGQVGDTYRILIPELISRNDQT